MGDGRFSQIDSRIYELGINLFLYMRTFVGHDYIIPSDGKLDKALQLAITEQQPPSDITTILHFADGRMGLECVELQDMIAAAHQAEILGSNTKSYIFSISANCARRLIERSSNPDISILASKTVEYLAN